MQFSMERGARTLPGTFQTDSNCLKHEKINEQGGAAVPSSDPAEDSFTWLKWSTVLQLRSYFIMAVFH